MRTRCARLIAMIVLLLTASAAHAECMAIQPFVCPRGTDTIPPNPRLTLFWPRRLPPRAPSLLVSDDQGRPLTHRLRVLSRTSAYDAYAVEVTAASGTRLVVTGGPQEPGLRAAYRVEAAWRKPAVGTWSYGVESSSSEWSCSFERIQTLSLPVGASAYRVEWTPDGVAGPVRSVVVPAQAGWFFSASQPRGERDRLAFGHLNCIGWNFRWDDDAVILRVRGLHPDGSEDDPSPPVRIAAPPRLSGRRATHDTPDELGSLEGAWQSLLSALQSGRPDAVRRVCTPAGWSDLQDALGIEPALLIETGEAWSDAALRWLPNRERSGEGRWGPEIKEHSFRFALIDDEWLLDGYSPGE